MDIKIISSTDRPGSNTRIFSEHVKEKFSEYAGVETEIVCLMDFPLADVQGGVYGHEPQSVIDFREPIVNADGLVFVIPEYNGGFPGILKMFIDYLPFPKAFNKMPIAYIGIANGAFGALRPVEQFQMIAGYRNALSFPERVFVPRFNKEFDPALGLVDPRTRDLLKSQIINFTAFVEANRETSLA
jgi:NAD(P)H-dependent FMN reductase